MDYILNPKYFNKFLDVNIYKKDACKGWPSFNTRSIDTRKKVVMRALKEALASQKEQKYISESIK